MRYIGIVAAAISVAIITGGWYWYTQQDIEPAVRIVDVSEQDIYQDAHIPGAINVQLAHLDQALERWNPSTPIVFYCTNVLCTASKEAAQKARKRGFSHAYAYKGGMAEWYQLAQQNPNEYSVVGPAQEPYLTLQFDMPEQKDNEGIVITAQELQKLQKTGILPSKS